MKRNLGVRIVSTVAAILTVLMMAVPAAAADWPNFRNGASNAANSGETIMLPLTERWHSTAPEVEENGVVVSGGVAYMSTEDGKLFAFAVATGTVVPGFPVITAPNFGTPAVDAANHLVYALAGGKLFAFNLDGSPTWTAIVGTTGNNFSQGPLVDGSYVIFKSGGNLQKYSSGGVLQWTAATSGTGTQPAIMGNYIYVNSETGQIRKYDKSTGAEVTTGGFPIAAASSISPLTAVDGKIFLRGDKVYAYDAATGSLAWAATDGGYSTFSSSPAVGNGAVYVYGFDGKAYAFDENTGALLAGFPTVALNPVPGTLGRNWGSPAIAGDKLFVGAGTTQKMKVVGVAGSDNAGVVLAEYPTFSTDPQGFDLCSPVVSGGVVFAMLDGGGLYAFFASGTAWTGGAITINRGDAQTASQNVTLALDRGSNAAVNEMRISEDPFFAGAAWETYATTRAWTLSAGYGLKTVYVQFRDAQGQSSNVFNDQIEYIRVFVVQLTGTQLEIKPEAFDANTGEFIAFIVLPAPYDTLTITDAVADGAPQVKINFDAAEHKAIIKFRRADITVLPLDTYFEVTGHFLYNGTSCQFAGSDDIQKVKD